MECNKEEASRAKDLAVIKLQEADYAGAKKIALKAQKLFPGLENISQLLTVCEVHCCAAVKINGETDWYRILQVDTAADDMLLKKQYRKLALLLHPDKNKFVGAEAAFKLIGEAHMILTDQVKRSFHDSKRNPVIAKSAPLPKKRERASKKTDHVAKRANKDNTDAGYSTFWTICLACGTKYHYSCSFLMQVLPCRVCSRSFLAYDLSKKPPVQVAASNPWSGIGMQQQIPPSQQTYANNRQHSYHSVPDQQNPVTSRRAPVSNQQQQPQNVADQKIPDINQQQRSKKVPFNSGTKKVDSDPWAAFGMKQQPQSVADQNIPDINQQQRSKKVPFSSGTKKVDPDPWAAFGMKQQPQNVADKKIPDIDQQQQSKKVPLSSGTKKVDSDPWAAFGIKQQPQNVADKKIPDINQQQQSKKVPFNSGPKNVDSDPLAAFGMKHQPQDVADKKIPDMNQQQRSKKVPFSSGPKNVDSHPWGAFGMKQENFPPSQQVNVADQKLYYNRAPGQQNPASDHQASVTCQQQHSLKAVDKQTPFITQQQQSQKFSFNSGPKNVVDSQFAACPNSNTTANNNLTAEAGVCNSTEITRPPVGQNGEGRSKSPVVNSDKIPLVNQQIRVQGGQVAKEAVLTATNADETSVENPCIARHQGDTVISEDQSDGCRKGRGHLTGSPANKRMRKENSSCMAGKSDHTTENDGAKSSSQHKLSIPSKEKVATENGEVIDGLHVFEGTGGKQETPVSVSGSAAAVRSVNNSIPFNITVSCPDSDFYDFEKNRDADRFAVDQIWAIYDDHDGMPRYYARIKQVYSPNFMVRFTWLEHDPLYDAEKAWSSKELPVACGSFRVGTTHLTEDAKMFSHVVSWTKGRKRNIYEIYPKKGEVWAVFRGWDIKWSSDSNDHRPYDYDIVEITSDFAKDSGTYVIPLVKIKGFVSLFVRSSNEAPFLIPGSDTLRFSHSIPFHRLSQADRQHIPNGALELDTASLPPDLEKAFTPVNLDSWEMPVGNTEQSQDCKNTNVQDEVEKLNQNTNSEQDNGSEASVIDDHCDDGWNDSSQPESPTSFDYPDPEFCNFTSLRSFDKFKKGQVWALYCDTDKFPKYYGFIKTVDPDEYTIHIKWLEHCPCVEMEKRLMQDDLPIGCGTFKVSRQGDIYDCTDVFSHIMEVAVTSKGKKYEILPRVGQVWAIHKNWSCTWTSEDYSKYGYFLAEVMEISNGNIIVSCLTKVEGFSTVFKPEKEGQSSAMRIAKNDLMMFSHQIPAFRLTNGNLCGYWELDPASVPDVLLVRKTK